jgi:riboflavin kinase/FMN adenylyltransferase
MQVLRDILQLPNLIKPIVTIGIFDGVHNGHRRILRIMQQLAKQEGKKTVAITFEPHPRTLLNREQQEMAYISLPEKKIDCLAQNGLDYLLILEFNAEMASLSAEYFVKQYLVDKLNIGTLVTGYDHHFGKDRSGDSHETERLGKKYDFSVVKVSKVTSEGHIVSSTNIRKALMKGDIETANKHLGYLYNITGKVIHGNMLGRTIGFPTLNLAFSDNQKLAIANGVYACLVLINGKWHKGMGNIGYRPTISDNRHAIEIHVFDVDEDLYDKVITIAFVKRLRSEIKFSDIEQLKQQLTKDKTVAQQLFNEKGNDIFLDLF